MFDDIPTVLSGEELIDKMFRRAKRVEVPYSRNRLSMEKNLSIAKIYTARDVAVTALRNYVESFPYIDKLHPFYRSLLDLLVDKNRYKKSLASLNWAAGRIESFASKYSSRIKSAGRFDEILKLRKEFYGRAASVIKDIDSDLKYLNNARNTLRKLPTVDVNALTIVIAGYPNVGKSEFVRRVSSAKPEVASYPFTTKGIILGHIELKGARVQIIDTPGLLDRPLSERNKIEKQAILALRYLANLIVFILDPSETCGYGIGEQLNLLKEIKTSFGVKTIEVENKVDIYRSGSERLKISARTGENVDKLVGLMLKELGLGKVL